MICRLDHIFFNCWSQGDQYFLGLWLGRGTETYQSTWRGTGIFFSQKRQKQLHKRPKNQFAFFRGLRSYMSVKSNHNSERGRPRYIFKVPKTTFDFRCPPAKIPCIPRCRISWTLPKGRFIINRKGSYPGGGGICTAHEKGRNFFFDASRRGGVKFWACLDVGPFLESILFSCWVFLSSTR